MATHVPLPSSGLNGVELRSSNRTRGSAPLKLRPPLLEEGAGAFPVVLARHRLDLERPEARAALVRPAREIRLDRGLRAAHRQRRVVRQRGEVVVRGRLEL